MQKAKPLVVQDKDCRRDSWNDSVKGKIGWRTLFSADATATDSLTAGVAEVEPGGWLGLHRHSPAEIYYVIEGRGVVTVDGAEHQVSPGSAVFIPGNAEHGVRNEGSATLRFLYAFAVDSFADVEYRFSASQTDA
jgi:quercetin dioxygenase-like cupin family protein